MTARPDYGRLRERPARRRGRPFARPHAVAFTAAALALLAVATVPAVAWWKAGARLDGVQVSAGRWATASLSLTPGCAQGVHISACPEPGIRLLPVATVGQGGALQLDFGDVLRGRLWPFADVVRVASRAAHPVSLRFSATGDITQLIAYIGFARRVGPVLTPGAVRSLLVSFSVPRAARLGPYQGAILIDVLETGERYELPAIITVVRLFPKASEHSQAGSLPASPAPSASPSQSADVVASPTPGSSPTEPAAAPSPEPALPSATPSPETLPSPEPGAPAQPGTPNP